MIRLASISRSAPSAAPNTAVRGSWASRVTEANASWSAASQSARSNHPGGVNLLMGDGSTSFVDEAIDLSIWQAISTPGALDGEPLVTEF